MWLLLALPWLVAQVPVDSGGADAGVEAPEAQDEDRKHLTVVTGSRTERKAEDAIVATEVITRTQIEQLGVRDLPQLLQQHSGVEMVYTNRGTGLRLQGMDPEYVLILVDGQRVSGRSGAFTDISRFSLRDVERIEIVKGPAAALYGADAIGGVINLITRRPQKQLEASLRGMFGSLMEGDVRGHVGSKLGPFELTAGGGYRTRAAYDWAPQDVAQSLPSLRRIDGDAQVAYVPNARSRTFVRSAYVFNDFQAIDLNDSGAVFDRFQRTEQFDLWAGTANRFETDTTLSVRGHFGLFRDQFLVDQRGSRALDEYSSNLTRLWEGVAQVDQKVGRHLLTAGVEGYAELLTSSRIDPNEVQRGRVGLWLQDEWTLVDHGPRLALSPGLRVDADSQFGAAPSPRLAVKLDPTPALTLRASWGLGFRPPTFSELYLRFSNAGIGYIVQGNPKLTAERSGSVNVGVDYRPLSGWVDGVGQRLAHEPDQPHQHHRQRRSEPRQPDDLQLRERRRRLHAGRRAQQPA
jgi:outer membrane receptor for ferrienterochelin and colicins